jgi:hypothetical protein
MTRPGITHVLSYNPTNSVVSVVVKEEKHQYRKTGASQWWLRPASIRLPFDIQSNANALDISRLIRCQDCSTRGLPEDHSANSLLQEPIKSCGSVEEVVIEELPIRVERGRTVLMASDALNMLHVLGN